MAKTLITGLMIALAGITASAQIALLKAPPKAAAAKHARRPRGARPSPRHKLVSTPRHVARPGIPVSYGVIPSQLSYWGNDVDGDCVSAEEAYAKATYSVMIGLPELFIPSATLVTWASSNGYLNGANLTDVMDTMISQGITVGGTTYTDGPYTAVDWTSDTTLSSAIFTGPVKLGIAGDQLENVVGTTNGWFATGFSQDSNEDHCVCLVGYGTLAQCFQILATPLPAGADPAAKGYILGTWDTFGVIDQPSMLAITGEAWLRSPTTPQETPAPTPTPAPVPPSPPTPDPNVFTANLATMRFTLPSGWRHKPDLGNKVNQVNLHFGARVVETSTGWTPE